MDIAGVVVGFETELSFVDLLVAEISPKTYRHRGEPGGNAHLYLENRPGAPLLASQEENEWPRLGPHESIGATRVHRER
jgi:hypothetical protein